jgi:hypothetical protein
MSTYSAFSTDYLIHPQFLPLVALQHPVLPLLSHILCLHEHSEQISSQILFRTHSPSALARQAPSSKMT